MFGFARIVCCELRQNGRNQLRYHLGGTPTQLTCEHFFRLVNDLVMARGVFTVYKTKGCTTCSATIGNSRL